MQRQFILILLAAALFTACEPGKKTSGGGADTLAKYYPPIAAGDTVASVITSLRGDMSPGVQNPTEGLGPRMNFAAGKSRFSVATVDGLIYTPFDSISWYELHENYTAPENDQVAYFFLEGEPVELSATHIRVEWMAKGYEQRNKEEELFSFIKGVYQVAPRNGRVISEGLSLKTLDGKQVKLLEMYMPQVVIDTIPSSSKICAWAWVDQGHSFIGFNLSSTEPEKYKRAIALFRKMLMSFRDE